MRKEILCITAGAYIASGNAVIVDSVVYKHRGIKSRKVKKIFAVFLGDEVFGIIFIYFGKNLSISC